VKKDLEVELLKKRHGQLNIMPNFATNFTLKNGF